MTGKIFVWLFISLSFLPFIALGANDSTQVLALNAQPVERAIETKTEGCITTPEQRYSVSMLSYQDAYPDCPANMTIEKINLRTEAPWKVEVVTYVSLKCCPQRVGWRPAPPGRYAGKTIDRIVTPGKQAGKVIAVIASKASV